MRRCCFARWAGGGIVRGAAFDKLVRKGSDGSETVSAEPTGGESKWEKANSAELVLLTLTHLNGALSGFLGQREKIFTLSATN